MSVVEIKFRLKQIEPTDRLTGLSLGDAQFTPLKTFLAKHAKAYQEQNLATTYGIFDTASNKISAYVTLVCGEIVVDGQKRLLNEPGLSYDYKSYPAIKIARLAVHVGYRGLDLGTQLVTFALGTAKNVVCPAVGCRFAVVDAKTNSVGFYLKCGFTILDTEANKTRPDPIMFIDLHKAAKHTV